MYLYTFGLNCTLQNAERILTKMKIGKTSTSTNKYANGVWHDMNDDGSTR